MESDRLFWEHIANIIKSINLKGVYNYGMGGFLVNAGVKTMTLQWDGV